MTPSDRCDKSDSSERLIPKHGGYRKLRSFRCAQEVYDATVLFCDRFVEKRSRTHDQMVQAARSGVREIRWSSREREELSETEAAILSFLVAHGQRAVTREELLTRLWGIGHRGLETRTIDMHIVRIRAKLRDPAGKHELEAIVTVRAQGYMAGRDLLPLAPASAAEVRA